MNIERHVQQRSMFLPNAGDGTISGIAPGISSGVPFVAGSREHRLDVGVGVARCCSAPRRP